MLLVAEEKNAPDITYWVHMFNMILFLKVIQINYIASKINL